MNTSTYMDTIIKHWSRERFLIWEYSDWGSSAIWLTFFLNTFNVLDAFVIISIWAMYFKSSFQDRLGDSPILYYMEMARNAKILSICQIDPMIDCRWEVKGFWFVKTVFKLWPLVWNITPWFSNTKTCKTKKPITILHHITRMAHGKF